MLSLLLGFFLSVVVAKEFGVSREVDAFFAAYTIPDMLSQILFSFSMLLVTPLVIEKQVMGGKGNLSLLIGKLFSTLSILTIIAVGILIIFAPLIIKVYVPGFDLTTRQIASNLLRILSCIIFFIGLSGFFTAILNAFNDFLIGSLTRVFVNVLAIIMVLLYSDRLGITVYGIGIVLGSILAFILQVPFLRKYVWFRPNFSFKDPALSATTSHVLPLLLARFFGYFTEIFQKFLASGISIGSISMLSYSLKIVQLPIVLSISLGTAVYPQLALNLVNSNKESMSALLLKIYKWNNLLLLPLSGIVFLFADEIIYAVFVRGAFDVSKATDMSLILRILALGIPFVGLNGIIGNTFWVSKLMSQRLQIEFAGILVNVVLAVFLTKYFGLPGLAFAYTAQFVFLFILGLWKFDRLLLIDNALCRLVINDILLKSLTAGIAMLLCWLVTFSLRYSSLLNALVNLLFGSGLFLTLYFSLCYLFKVDEVNEVIAVLSHKFVPKRETSE